MEPVVFIVDDDNAMRDSLSYLLTAHGFNIQSFNSSEKFLAYFKPDMRGCLILDVRMPGMDGLALQNHLLDQHVNIPTIFITGHADIPTAITAIKEGGFDFLEKPVDETVLTKRIKEAIELDRQCHQSPNPQQQIQARAKALTPRERLVMQQVIGGASNRQLAAHLNLSPKTVEIYRARMMQKMGAQNLPALIAMAVQSGLE